MKIVKYLPATKEDRNKGVYQFGSSFMWEKGLVFNQLFVMMINIFYISRKKIRIKLTYKQ
jgi:hypothetical protein